ncbi:CDP-glycerol glycerophosphotransferase family protein [Cytobacillus sp. Sa5YUA1]|uniref:CDP-glycerol glycerophosphotransferase family protein n=1 Tax=Cytobacillus stercorigallinarum TaxID=2762240 RepID=A0ABR8QNX1_9BACI|nr:CDP-glycerol glycerophosphotransferase family protein [Cytobacillus stercorigallinarum]MBD7937193.1 CDP-glycerol glycerophosphotransferase family protein [Cytobacillus stercorigallinarum]
MFDFAKKVKRKVSRKLKTEKQKTKEYIINNLLSYGELMDIKDDDSKIVFKIKVENKLANHKNIKLLFHTKDGEVFQQIEGINQEKQSNVIEFIISKSDILLPPNKRTYHVSLLIGKKKIRVRFSDCFVHKDFQYFLSNSHLFLLRWDRHNRVFFKISYLNGEMESIYDIPNTIESIRYEEKIIKLSGSIYLNFLDEEILKEQFFLEIRRPNGYSVKTPMSINGNQYTANIILENTSFSIKGKWKFFITVNHDTQSFRFPMYVRNEKAKENTVEFFLPTHRETMHFRTKVINGKIYAHTRYLSIRPNNIYFKREQNIVTVTLEFTKDKIEIFNESESDIFLRLRQRDTNEFTSIKMDKEVKEDVLMIYTKLDYSILGYDALDRPRRWDLFIGVETIESQYIDFRIINNVINKIKNSTTYIFENQRDCYFFEFYGTRYNKLSLVYSRARLNKFVSKFYMKDHHFYLEGQIYFESEFVRENIQYHPYIELINRRNMEAIRYEASVKNERDFIVSIPISEFKSIVDEFKEIIDFYLILEGESIFRKVKLGLREYTYHKDKVFLDFISEDDTQTYEYNLTTTPKGNIKFESFIFENKIYKEMKTISKTPQSNEIWLVGERPDTAQDNGYRFFEYCRNHFPELQVYYVIDGKSPDIEKVSAFGNVLEIGSIEHIKKSLQASAFIGTHDLDYILPFKGIKYENYRKAKKIFLQHGVLGRKNVPYHKVYYEYPFDLFIVSSQAEKDMVIEQFGYNEDEVVVTGLARFDKLQENHHPKREILLIPTWREWINSEDNLIQSSYFEKYMGFIQSQELSLVLEKYNLRLNFYPHYRMQQYIKDHVPMNNNRIKLVEFGEKSVQELLKENSIMVTDYSSVSFDFTFLGKPVIYFHFDSDLFFANGILRPIEETFLGDIVSSHEELVNKIEEAVLRDFKERPDIMTRKSDIFSVLDKNNNERIFNCINHLRK